jgi:hypothetical protein
MRSMGAMVWHGSGFNSEVGATRCYELLVRSLESPLQLVIIGSSVSGCNTRSTEQMTASAVLTACPTNPACMDLASGVAVGSVCVMLSLVLEKEAISSR